MIQILVVMGLLGQVVGKTFHLLNMKSCLIGIKENFLSLVFSVDSLLLHLFNVNVKFESHIYLAGY